MDGEWCSPSSSAIRRRCLAWARGSLGIPSVTLLASSSPGRKPPGIAPNSQTDFRPVLVGWESSGLAPNAQTDFRPVLVGWQPDHSELLHKCSSSWKPMLNGWKLFGPDCNASSP